MKPTTNQVEFLRIFSDKKGLLKKKGNMSTKGEVTFFYKEIQGLKVPNTYKEERYLSAINYQPNSDDIFLITYPKCGSTWAQQIMYIFFHNGNPPVDVKDLYSSIPYLERMGAEAAENMPRPGVIKMHTPYHITPYHPSAKYIIILRNPKDCCVSMYYHAKENAMFSRYHDLTFDEFFEFFVKGDCIYGDYFDHTLSWYGHRNDPNVLVLTYEEMKQDLRPAIYRIAEFLGTEWKERLGNEPELADRIIKGSSVEAMKDRINKGMAEIMFPSDVSPSETTSKPADGSDLPGKDVSSFADRRPPAITRVRKGIIGDWRNHFSEEQNIRLNERIKEKTEGTDLMDLWKGLDLGL